MTDENKTDNGFYIGDKVEYSVLEETHTSTISEIEKQGFWAWSGNTKVPASVVKLADGTRILDTKLTRV